MIDNAVHIDKPIVNPQVIDKQIAEHSYKNRNQAVERAEIIPDNDNCASEERYLRVRIKLETLITKRCGLQAENKRCEYNNMPISYGQSFFESIEEEIRGLITELESK